METIYWFCLIYLCRVLVWFGWNKTAHFVFERSGLHRHLLAAMRAKHGLPPEHQSVEA